MIGFRRLNKGLGKSRKGKSSEQKEKGKSELQVRWHKENRR